MWCQSGDSHSETNKTKISLATYRRYCAWMLWIRKRGLVCTLKKFHLLTFLQLSCLFTIYRFDPWALLTGIYLKKNNNFVLFTSVGSSTRNQPKNVD